MKQILATLILTTGLMLAFSCKEVQQSSGNPVPRIQFIKIEPTVVKEFRDSVKITIAYEDGDGDLGFVNADINSMEVQDERLSKPDVYYVAPLAPVDAKISIKGKLTMLLKNVFLLGTGSTETTTFTVRLMDRAGNYSNPVKSTEITINR